MNNQKFPTVNSDLLGKIILLANQRAESEYNKYPNGFVVGETKVVPESPAALELRQVIDALSLSDARELYALMYLGRDGLGNETAAEAIAFSLDQAASCGEFDIKDKLDEKTPLATYLLKGIELAAGIRVADIETQRK